MSVRSSNARKNIRPGLPEPPCNGTTAEQTRKEAMKNKTKPIPDGFHTLTPHLVVKGASKAIEFYKKAFGAEEMKRMPGPDGKSIIHADLKIGNSHLMLVDEFPDMNAHGPESIGGTPVTIHMFVEDADAVFNKAVE